MGFLCDLMIGRPNQKKVAHNLYVLYENFVIIDERAF